MEGFQIYVLIEKFYFYLSRNYLKNDSYVKLKYEKRNFHNNDLNLQV